MRIGGFQKISLIDFPGHIAAVIFTQGCPWKCQYCHNPGLSQKECFCQPIDEKPIWDYLGSRRSQIDGVVISGGEPTMHSDLPQLLSKIHDMGYAIKLDTNGTFPGRLEPILKSKLVDYVAMDLKADFENDGTHYVEVAGTNVFLDDLKRSMAIIRSAGIPYEWRTTVSPQLPIDPVAIAKAIKKGERYYLQAFRVAEKMPNSSLRATLDPSRKGQILRELELLGIEASWR